MNQLCGHPDHLSVARGHRAVCTVCGSFRDTEFQTPVHYDKSYPATRNHFDPAIGALKAQTVMDWIRRQTSTSSESSVLEVGFGGGFPLQALQREGYRVYGLESDSSHIAHAVSLGLPPQNLFTTENRPQRLTEPIDLWIFSDSFEHVPNPNELAEWVRTNSSEQARVLMVLPKADSLSQSLLGKQWPHRLPDHSFHWSEKGLVEFWRSNGFELEQTFYPGKFINLEILGRHLKLKTGLNPIPRFLNSVGLHFNIGEMGLVLKVQS